MRPIAARQLIFCGPQLVYHFESPHDLGGPQLVFHSDTLFSMVLAARGSSKIV